LILAEFIKVKNKVRTFLWGVSNTNQMVLDILEGAG
jgi:hypothetical protein